MHHIFQVRHRRALAAMLAAAAHVSIALPLVAADRRWVDVSGGLWTDAANWSPSVPVAGDRAIFDLSDTGYTITSPAADIRDVGLLVRNDRVVLDLFGGAGLPGRTFEHAFQPFLLGDVVGDDARLTVIRGVFDTRPASSRLIGEGANASGRLVIGNGATWFHNGSETTVGHSGNGEVIILDGGSSFGVAGTFHLGRNVGASGSFTVTGGGSSFQMQTLNLGDSGAGNVSVEDAGALSITSGVMGINPGSSSTLSVDGAGSGFNVGGFVIGNRGSAAVTISAGGRFASTSAVSLGIGAGSNASALITGANSRMAVGSTLLLGGSALGQAVATLAVENGGKLTSGPATLARDPGNTAHVRVTGLNSVWQSNNLIVAADGDATLTVADGAFVSTDGAVIGEHAGSSGRVLVTGSGSSFIAGAITVSAGGVGSMEVADGAHVSATRSVIVGGDAPGTLRIAGANTLLEVGSGDLVVGRGGSGTLLVEAGATVRARGIQGAGASLSNPRASITVTGPGTSLAATLAGIGLGGDLAGNTISFGGPTTVVVSDRAQLSSAAHLAIVQNSSLSLATGATASVATRLSVFNSSLLHVDGSSLFVGTAFDNFGETRLSGQLGRISAQGSGEPVLRNSGLVGGNGRIDLPLNNLAAGEIRAAAGERLHFASARAATNEGSINLLGGTVQFNGDLTNTPAGRVNGRGTFMAPMLANEGVIQLSSGISDFFTPIVNKKLSKVIVSGGASATFYGTVENVEGSEFRVSQNSTATFFAAVTGDDLFTGVGAVNFEGGQSSVGPLAIGAAHVATAASLDTGAFDVGSLSVEGEMQVRPGSPVSRTASLTIDAGASLDLADNDLIVDGGNPAEISAMITSGRLTTSAATPFTALAAIQNVRGDGTAFLATFSGEAVDAADVLVKFTYTGDANFDGRVSIADYLMVDRATARGQGGWIGGDFDYTGGPADAADYFLMDQAFLAQGAPLAGLTATGATPVPEPSLAGLLLALLVRRRRRGRRD